MGRLSRIIYTFEIIPFERECCELDIMEEGRESLYVCCVGAGRVIVDEFDEAIWRRLSAACHLVCVV